MPLLIALALALLLAPASGWVGARAGLVDRPGPFDPSGLKIHARPVPLLGGAAVAAAAALTAQPPLWVLASVAVGFGTGLLDDVRPLPPWVRIVLLGAAGALLAAAGDLDGLLGPFAFPAVVFLVLACTNGVNLLDGQDGLAGGVAAPGAAGLAGIAQAAGAVATAELGLAVSGAALGFLFWNRPPARIFLGNSGAYAVGVLLAALATGAVGAGGWPAVPAAAMCLAVPAFEIGFTVVRRVTAHTSLTVGDRSHSYDLVAIEVGSRPWSTAIFVAASVVLAAAGAATFTAPVAVSAAVVVATAVGSAMWSSRLWARRAEVSHQQKGVSL